MARITIEDCIEKIPNRFDLTMSAAVRTRELRKGHDPKVAVKQWRGSNGETESEKFTVVALREIAAGEIGTEMLRKLAV